MADIQERLNAARSEAQQLEQQLRQAVDSRKDKSRKILIFFKKNITHCGTFFFTCLLLFFL